MVNLIKKQLLLLGEIKMKNIKIVIIIGVMIMLLSGCSRQKMGYSFLQMLGFSSDYSYLQDIEDGAELKINDDIEAIIEYDKHPQDGNDISFYSARFTKADDIKSIVNQITNNEHWKTAPLESAVSDVLYETDALKEADFPEIKNGYYIFYWDYDSITSAEIEKIYGVTAENKNKIDAETCKYLGYFDTDTNTVYFISFFENELKP